LLLVRSLEKQYISHNNINIDFNQPDFADLTLTRQINQVQQQLKQTQEDQFILIGSSFGGLTANLVAQLYPEKIKALIFLAPALNFIDYWQEKITADILSQWQEKNGLPIYHYGEKKEISLKFSFWQDLQNYQLMMINHQIPTLIFHGIHDETIPIEVSRIYAQNHPNVSLQELDSDHGLNDRHQEIFQGINQWLSLIINSNK
jgi:uncharacterized protein